MEKKTGRSVQPLKGGGFDKKNQDSNNGKLWTKGAIRRESASGSLSIKPEASRKTPTQHNKSFDKRPRPRGRSDAVARDETSSLEEEHAELGSVFRQGSKKISLNKLFVFNYPSRNGMQRQYDGRGAYPRHGNHSLYARKSKYVKEHFLQANCQFIVNTSGDYKQYLSNPDALVEWNYIEQINVQVNDSPSCPICLHLPTSAKITRCGHIYCWSCILHYLSLSDKPQRKCPICYENVCKEDLKSVVVIPHNTFNVGETITFKLMKRNENSLTPYPAEEKIIQENVLMSFSEEQPVKMYSKLLLAQHSDILSIINRENRELRYQLNNEEESEKCFIEEAIVYLKERETSVIEDLMRDVDITGTSPDGAKIFVNQSSSNTETSTFNTNDSPDHTDAKYTYFYQACDGQHIYIHSINARMLKHTYGSLEYAPNTITAKILTKEGDSMSEDHRKHYKYLAHLPVACPFETFEIELKKPIVNQDTLDYFHNELEKRKKKRAKKAKEEKQREKRITEEENIKLYKRYPSANIPLQSEEQFPTFNMPPLEDNREILSDIGHIVPCQDHAGPSFAKMAAVTKPTSNPWPDLKGATSVVIPTNIKKLKELSVISGRRRGDSTSTYNDDSSDHEFVPESRTTFGDAIAQALQKASKNETLPELSSGGASKNKKKKKNKQKTLLSTSLGYCGD